MSAATCGPLARLVSNGLETADAAALIAAKLAMHFHRHIDATKGKPIAGRQVGPIPIGNSFERETSSFLAC